MLANPNSYRQEFVYVTKPDVPEGIEDVFAKAEANMEHTEYFPLEVKRIVVKNEPGIIKYSMPELKSIAIQLFNRKFDVKTRKAEIVQFLTAPEQLAVIKNYGKPIPRHVTKQLPTSKNNTPATSRRDSPITSQQKKSTIKSPTSPARGRGRPKSVLNSTIAM